MAGTDTGCTPDRQNAFEVFVLLWHTIITEQGCEAVFRLLSNISLMFSQFQKTYLKWPMIHQRTLTVRAINELYKSQAFLPRSLSFILAWTSQKSVEPGEKWGLRGIILGAEPGAERPLPN